RERPVADVMEERRDLDVERGLRRQLAVEPTRDALRDVKGAQRMTEPRVLGAWIDEPGEPHLLDAAQPLHHAGIEQVRDRPIGALELDEPMHRIAEYAVFHASHR